jgi:hypothetical protein
LDNTTKTASLVGQMINRRLLNILGCHIFRQIQLLQAFGFPMWRRAWYRDDMPFVASIVDILDIYGFRWFLKGTLWTKDDDKTILK